MSLSSARRLALAFGLVPAALAVGVFGFPAQAQPAPAATLSASAGAGPAPAGAVSRDLGPLAPQVHALFERSCAECHDRARRSKPKGGFGHVLDLPRLAADDHYVTPGRPDQSELYTVLVDTDPDVLMPPPDSDAPKLTPAEIKLVSDWIISLGAPAASPADPAATAPGASPGGGKSAGGSAASSSVLTPSSAPGLSAPAAPQPPSPDTTGAVSRDADKPPASRPDAGTLFARTHVMVVHFPIALLMLAAFVEWLGVFTGRRERWLPAVLWMLGVSALAAPVAALAGWWLADREGYRDATVFNHRWLGVATAVTSIICWLLLRAAEKNDSARLRLAARLLLVVAALLVALAGHTGGELVYGEGYPFR